MTDSINAAIVIASIYICLLTYAQTSKPKATAPGAKEATKKVEAPSNPSKIAGTKT